MQKYRDFVERHSFVTIFEFYIFERQVLCEKHGESPETMRKLCLSTKFTHEEIRWNYGIFLSVKYKCSG